MRKGILPMVVGGDTWQFIMEKQISRQRVGPRQILMQEVVGGGGGPGGEGPGGPGGPGDGVPGGPGGGGLGGGFGGGFSQHSWVGSTHLQY